MMTINKSCVGCANWGPGGTELSQVSLKTSKHSGEQSTCNKTVWVSASFFSIHFLSSFYWLISKAWSNILEPKHRLQKASHATIACFGAKITNLVWGKEKESLLVAASHSILHRRNKTVIHLILTYIIYDIFMLLFFFLLTTLITSCPTVLNRKNVTVLVLGLTPSLQLCCDNILGEGDHLGYSCLSCCCWYPYLMTKKPPTIAGLSAYKNYWPIHQSGGEGWQDILHSNVKHMAAKHLVSWQ